MHSIATAPPRGIFGSLREFFTLRGAEQTARSYTSDQAARIRLHFDAARRRESAGRRLLEAGPASLLLRDAVAHYVRALAIAADAATDADAIGPGDLAEILPEIPPDAARPEAAASDNEVVRRALSAGSESLYLDRLPFDEAERTRGALQRAAALLRRSIEPRSPYHLRAARWGRIAAVVLVAAYAAQTAFASRFLPTNVARGKKVHASSLVVNPPDGHELVDGPAGRSFGIATRIQDSPEVVIDLEDVYRIYTIKVHNRLDAWFDDCLPLILEISTDGVHYTELARRTEHFDADPPWTVDGRRELARYVRLRVPSKTDIVLSQVEVFGMKPRR